MEITMANKVRAKPSFFFFLKVPLKESTVQGARKERGTTGQTKRNKEGIIAYHWAVREMSRLLFSFKWSWVVMVVDVTIPARAAPEDDKDGFAWLPSEKSEISDEEGLEAVVGESKASACLRSIS